VDYIALQDKSSFQKLSSQKFRLGKLPTKEHS
jgi:hypothetical protein